MATFASAPCDSVAFTLDAERFHTFLVTRRATKVCRHPPQLRVVWSTLACVWDWNVEGADFHPGDAGLNSAQHAVAELFGALLTIITTFGGAENGEFSGGKTTWNWEIKQKSEAIKSKTTKAEKSKGPVEDRYEWGVQKGEQASRLGVQHREGDGRTWGALQGTAPASPQPRGQSGYGLAPRPRGMRGFIQEREPSACWGWWTPTPPHPHNKVGDHLGAWRGAGRPRQVTLARVPRPPHICPRPS